MLHRGVSQVLSCKAPKIGRMTMTAATTICQDSSDEYETVAEANTSPLHELATKAMRCLPQRQPNNTRQNLKSVQRKLASAKKDKATPVDATDLLQGSSTKVRKSSRNPRSFCNIIGECCI